MPMHIIDDEIKAIKRAHETLGTAELARRANLPYTTVDTASKRGFTCRQVEVVSALSVVAREHGAS